MPVMQARLGRRFSDGSAWSRSLKLELGQRELDSQLLPIKSQLPSLEKVGAPQTGPSTRGTKVKELLSKAPAGFGDKSEFRSTANNENRIAGFSEN